MIGSIGNSSLFAMPSSLQAGGQKSANTGGAGGAESTQGTNAASGGEQLSEEEQKQVQELKNRDREVRAHENAHKTVGGPYVGSISYETQTGPDGREYAIGGEAQIDASAIPGRPEATIRKMDVIIRAALAPAEPSSQDYAVARSAQQARLAAQRELREQDENDPARPRENANQSGALTNLALINEQRDENRSGSGSGSGTRPSAPAPLEAAALFSLFA